MDNRGTEKEQSINITADSKGIFPLLTGQAPPFEEALAWLQFAYTANQTWAYVVPASTVIVQSTVVEGDELFLVLFANLQKLFRGA